MIQYHMRIGVDGNEANVEKQVGVSVYTLRLLNYARKIADHNTQFYIFLRSKPLSLMPKENEWFRYIIIPGPFAWLRTSLPLYLQLKRNIDVFFSPAHYSPPFCPVPLVVTIHDLSYVYYPQEFLKKDLYKLTHWTKESVEKAAKIICVSQTTKKDVMKHYAIPEEKIVVIYNGYEKTVSENKNNTSKILSTYSLSDTKYLLYAGTLQPRKNISFLVRTFAKLHINYPTLKLVLTGKKGWLYDEIFETVQSLSLQKKVIFTGYVSDEELITLYRNALCFVHPSLYEGFGLPLIEAMANGCPVVSSFASSLPEIGGDACLYFDPKNEADLTEKLQTIIESQTTRKELIRKGKERVTFFSWEKSGEETVKVLRQAV